MDTKRQKQVAEVIKRNFSQVLQFEALNICGAGILITVTQVKITPDLVNASIYLSVFGTEQIVYWREASAGMSGVAYFLSKNIVHLFFILLSPLLYITPRLNCASACPWSAAMRYHFAASA